LQPAKFLKTEKKKLEKANFSTYIIENGSACTLGNFTMEIYLKKVLFYEQFIERTSAMLSLINCCCAAWIELKAVEIKFEHDKLSFKVSCLSSNNALEHTPRL